MKDNIWLSDLKDIESKITNKERKDDIVEEIKVPEVMEGYDSEKVFFLKTKKSNIKEKKYYLS